MSVNPFAGLLDLDEPCDKSLNETSISATEEKQATFQSNNSASVKLSSIIESLFYFTINKSNNDAQLVLLEDLASNSTTSYLDLELLEQALFERILLESPEDWILPKSNKINYDACEKNVLIYLYKCYQRVTEYDCSIDIKNTSKSLILRNVILALQQPDLFQEQELTAQLLEIVKDSSYNPEDFFLDISKDFVSDGKIFLKLLFHSQNNARTKKKLLTFMAKNLYEISQL